MYTEKVNINKIVKGYVPVPKGTLFHGVLLEQEAEKASSKLNVPKSFTTQMEGRTHTVATGDGKIYLARVTAVGDGIDDMEIGDIVQFNAGLKDSFDVLIGSDTEVVLSSMSVMTVFQKPEIDESK